MALALNGCTFSSCVYKNPQIQYYHKAALLVYAHRCLQGHNTTQETKWNEIATSVGIILQNLSWLSSITKLYCLIISPNIHETFSWASEFTTHCCYFEFGLLCFFLGLFPRFIGPGAKQQSESAGVQWSRNNVSCQVHVSHHLAASLSWPHSSHQHHINLALQLSVYPQSYFTSRTGENIFSPLLVPPRQGPEARRHVSVTCIPVSWWCLCAIVSRGQLTAREEPDYQHCDGIRRIKLSPQSQVRERNYKENRKVL